MQPTDEDIKLLKEFYASGKAEVSVAISEETPYNRLVDLGLMRSRHKLSGQGSAYTLTAAGLDRASE